MPTHLSKSRIMSGLQCEKRLWLEIHSPELKPPLSAGQERVFAVGTEVGEVARTRFEGGTLVEAPYWNLPASISETSKLLGRPDVPHIYEAAFEADGVHVKVDVLSREPQGGWQLIEVKSTTKVKEEHITDVAIQWHVVERAGLHVTSCSLMHLNRECRAPDLSNLFELERVDARAASVREYVPAIIVRLHDVAQSAEEPTVPVGTHCTNPYACPFKAYCWQNVPEQSVFTIPRLPSELKDSLAARGILAAADAPLEELGASQARHVEMVRHGEPEIDAAPIRAALAELEFPLHFLDFETCADAIPRLTGLRPYDGYPFQFSLHILGSDGTLTHHEYLHEDASDPRPAVARALCEVVGQVGSLIAYNAGFEQRVIKELAEFVDALRDLVPRFFDLLVVIRNHYRHPGFLGSNSIKNVLPVLVPELSYDGMEVAKGDDAQAVWAGLVGVSGDNKPGTRAGAESRNQADAQTVFGFERENTLTQLREYCRLDTLAMVRIYEVLRGL